MILMNKRLTVNGLLSTFNRRRFLSYGLLTVVCSLLFLTSCGVYTFRDVSIDYSKFKTVKVGFLENKARYVNPQLSPKLTDNLKQKINNYTKLALVNGDNASYIITGYVSRYDVSLSAISNQTSAGNRLTVAANITVFNTVDNKTDNFTVSRDFDFSATQSLQQAEGQLLDDVITQLTDQIFNHIFSNW